jgi:serine/threonine protein kinase
MSWVSDGAIEHLRRVSAMPDLSDTHYRILDELGEGGMGAVYLAEDNRLGRQVAIKVLKRAEMDHDAVERIRREARIIARLEHPGIVPVHDVGTLPDGRVYYVMKRVDGRRLDELCRGGCPLAERLSIFERVCETVAFAHSRGVIHRDLKPQNIMVGSFGEVLVLDWGIAKQQRQTLAEAEPHAGGALAGIHDDAERAADTLGEADERTRTHRTAAGSIVGTPAYMSPEQRRGDIESVDELSDVYGLGALLYYLLTDRAPSGDGAATSGPGGVMQDSFVAELRRAGISTRLRAVCSKAMSSERGERYASAAELSEDIRAYRGGQPISAYRESRLERLGRFIWVYRFAILVLLAYLVMRVAVIYFRPAGGDQRAPVSQPVEKMVDSPKDAD